MGAIVPAVRAIVYEAAIGGFLIVGLPLLSLGLERGAPVLPEGAQAVGLALALAGGGLWLWATVVLVARGDGTPLPLDPPRRLVASGPYRWIRNPMHVGLIAFFAGEALLFRSIVFLAVVALLAVSAFLWSRHEERELERRFDGPYARYRDSVPGWFPRPRPPSGSARNVI
jgi:protein-S-isoprenylcysteine O-methyltransferase Ste14